MIRKRKIIRLLDKYLLENKNEESAIETTKQFIEKNKNWWSRDNNQGHITGSTWIFNHERTHCLLLFHPKYKCWLQLGGHINVTDKTLQETALREALEESGLKQLQLITYRIFDIDIHSIQSNDRSTSHYHFDVRFLLSTSPKQQCVLPQYKHKLKWFSFKEIEQSISNRSILKMFRKSKRWV